MLLEIEKFTLLNVEGKREVINNVQQISNIIIGILFFGSPSQSYVKGLTEIMTEIVKLIFLKDDSTLFPTFVPDKEFVHILNRFNKLQRLEEKRTRIARDRLYGDEEDEEDD